MNANEQRHNIAQIVMPNDLPGRLISLARVLARLPDGHYTIQMTKEPKRIQAEIVENIPINQVEFDQDDSRSMP